MLYPVELRGPSYTGTSKTALSQCDSETQPKKITHKMFILRAFRSIFKTYWKDRLCAKRSSLNQLQ